MNYGELKTEVLTHVIDTPTSVQTLVPNMVKRAVRKLQQKHNFKVMEAEISFITTPLNRTLGDRPTDWKQARGNPYIIEFNGRLVDMSWLASRSDAQFRWGTNSQFDYGRPQGLFEDDLPQVFTVYPFPDALSDYTDGNYRVTVPYWKYLGNLIADGDSNWFTDNADEWIVYQAVSDAFYTNEDEQRAQVWAQRAKTQYADVLLLDKDRRLAETQTLVPHIGARRPHTQE